MFEKDIATWTPPHQFNELKQAGERSARAVLLITLVTMVIEIAAGWWFNSMALLADGWHMSSHALALGLTALAYAAARHYAHDQRFAFGTWKIEVLSSFASAMMLLGVAALMFFESGARLLAPQAIRFDEAIVVAVLGLAVNLLCARLLHGAHHHGEHGHHHHEHEHEHESHAPSGHHHDLNMKAAYLHVLADAATSLLAIVALLCGKWLGWLWLDALTGILGGVLVSVWAIGLLRESGAALLDRDGPQPMVQALRERLMAAHFGGDIALADVHAWRVGAKKYAAVIAIVSPRQDLSPDLVRSCLADMPALYHVTVEINHCAPAP